MEEKTKELQSKVIRLQRKNAELFTMVDAIQSFATAKSAEQIISRLLEFCVQLTGAQKVIFLSTIESSKKLERGIFEAINPETYNFLKQQTKNLGITVSFNQSQIKNQACALSNCTVIPLRGDFERYVILVDLPLPENSTEYIETVSKITDPFVLALKEKETSEQLLRSEEAVRQGEQRLATTLASIGDAVIATDVYGKVTFMNAVAEELTGWCQSEANQKPIGLIFPIVNENTRLKVDNPVSKVLQLGKIVALANHTVLLTKDGREVAIDDSGSPIKDVEGNIIGVVLVFRDITERKAAEKERDTFVEFLRIASQSASKIDLIKSTLSFLKKQSDCEAIGIRLKEGDDYPYYETQGFSSEHLLMENNLCAKDKAGCIIRDFKGNPVLECMCGNVICERFDASKEFFTKKGTFWTNDTTKLLATTTDADRQANTRNRCNGEGYQSVALFALRVGNNRLGLLQLNDKRKNMFTRETIHMWERIADHLALALSRIIAEERLQDYTKNLETIVEEKARQLRDSERLAAIGATAGMVGHDIRNPLQAITGDVYLAKSELDGLPDGEEKKAILESLIETEKNIDYINKIVQDLQDFARPLNPKVEESDLKLVVESLIAKSSLPKNIEASVKVSDDARKINADSYYLNRILYNLITNSIQAMPQGGKLTIEAHKEEKDTVISVSDTGVGIPENVRNKMFTLMFTTKSKGQGFGLPVVKRMTEALGGTVSFESQEGKGTTFTVRLPPQKSKDN